MRNLPVRAGLGLAGLGFLAALPSFLAHLQYFLSGAVRGQLITGNWWLVGVNVALFVAFLGFLRVRRSIDWTQRAGMGIYAAFIVSLFVEMYGLPLSIYLGAGLVGGGVAPPDYLLAIPLLGTTLAMNAWMLLGVGITVLGMALVALGWYQVYDADGLVTTGLYAYSRHPQYVGIILIAFGWVIGWPSPLTLVMFPLVVAAYVHVARTEERDMHERFGEEYTRYSERVPLLV